MKKLLLLLLCVPLIGLGQNRYHIDEVYIDSSSRIPVEFGDYGGLYFSNYDYLEKALPDAVFLKLNDNPIYNGIIWREYKGKIKQGNYEGQIGIYKEEIFIVNGEIYKYTYQVDGKLDEEMTHVSADKWMQKVVLIGQSEPGLDDNVLQTIYIKQEYRYINGRFCRNGIERTYYQNGHLRSESSMVFNETRVILTYDEFCGGEQINEIPTYIEYYENGEVKMKVEYNLKKQEVISQECWDKKGNKIECE